MKKITVQCKYNHPAWQTDPAWIRWCKECCAEGTEEFVKFVVQSRNWTIESEYVDKDTLIKIRCDKNHLQNYHPQTFALKQCSTCIGRISDKTRQQFFDEVAERGGTVIGEYIDAKAKIECICANGHTFFPSPNMLHQNGNWCLECAGYSTREQCIERLNKIVEARGGKLLEEYKRHSQHIRLLCENSHEFSARPAELMVGQWCQECKRIIHENKLIQKITESHGKLLSKYVNCRTKIDIKCELDHIWGAVPHQIMRGSWCPACNDSRGERMVRTFLDENNISYVSQYMCLIGITQKYYDFFLPEYNLIIEYDGMQHFTFCEYFHKNDDGYERQKISDTVKTQYAKDNKIHLLRIPFWRYNESHDIISSNLDAIKNNSVDIIQPEIGYFQQYVEGKY